MSFILKGIDLPKDTRFTEVSFYNRKGELLRALFTGEQSRVIQINRPHGRLIDADLLKDTVRDSVPAYGIGVKIPTYGDMDIMDKIGFMPTILEAEE